VKSDHVAFGEGNRYMRMQINHQTHYDYEDFTRYAIQRLYLTPRDEPGQRVLRWELKGDG